MKSKTMTTDEALELADRLAEWLAPWATEGPRVACTVLSAEVRKLRARIEEMERQEPVVEVQWAAGIPNSFLDFISTNGYLPKLGDKLYALPGAKGEEK